MQSNEEFIKFLGEGSYGYVHLVRYTNDDGSSFLAAVKNSYDEDSDNLNRELQILRVFRGYPRIITCFGDFLQEGVSSYGNRVHKLLLEYAPEGSLNAFLNNYPERKLPEPLIKGFTRMILEGLVSIHGQGYVHCDIKSDNILVFPSSPTEEESSQYEVKLSDFGNCLEVGQVSLYWANDYPWVGTPIYMPPESVRDGVANKTLDLWSVGCLVLEMYTGVVPWEGVKLSDVAARLRYGEAPEIPASLPSDAKDFIETCLSRKPEERRSAYELLLHPFLPRRVVVEEEEKKETEDSFLLRLCKLRIRQRSFKKKSTTDVSDKKPVKLTMAPQFKRTLNKVSSFKIKKPADFNLVSVQ